MILIVGNVLKDVYLNLDTKNEPFETDKNGTKWLDFSFNASEHHFFNRHSSFGGAAVSLEVLQKLGLSATITDSDFSFDEGGPTKSTPADSYRYILISDDGVSYLTPNKLQITEFIAPNSSVDYIYIDRSANLPKSATDKLLNYLENHPSTKLILYIKDLKIEHVNTLKNHASLIFSEVESIDFEKTVYLTENSLTFKNITEPITVDRIDKLTHLSFYSIAAATILGSFILGKTIEKSLKITRANLENSYLDSTLTLAELQDISSRENDDLELIAASLVYPGKGILAADESGGSIKKKFAELNIPDTFENRHSYRDIFLSTPDIENYLSGIILFDETARDHTNAGETYVDHLTSRRIIPGIKVDQGLEKFKDSDETYTKGLDNLPRRLREYYEMGLRFAKWRAAFNITSSENGEIITPSDNAIEENCRILAEYARACQSAGLVPIVEPEVVYQGNYNIDTCAKITAKVLDTLFKELENFGINLRACILKCNMILAGKDYLPSSTPEEVGQKTAEVLKDHVPEDLAGIVFLSGGQTPEQATDNLAAILKNGPFPWPITFSFARAIQDPTLFSWSGDNNNIEKARQAFLDRLIANKTVLED